MLLHRYERSLRHPFTRHPAAGRDGAGLCQHSPALGFCLGLRVGRDRNLESAGPHPFAVSALARTEEVEGRGGATGGSGEKGAAGPGAAAMMGKRSPQDKLFAADHVYLDFVGRDTLYGYMAQNREQLFRDEDFAALYCPDNGRQSVPPSLAVSLLFLRAYEGVSFAEAVERTKYDLRWKVALGLEMEEVAMQKSALQEFEAKLVLHEMEEPILKKSIEEARRAGYLKNRKIRVALDTTPILGKGAVKDTYNLLAEGIEQLVRRVAEVEGEEVTGWAERQGFSRYFGSSLKGEAAIEWDDKAQREQLLTEMVQDGRRLLSLAEQGEEQHPEQAEAIQTDAALLRRLITQDVEEKPEGGCQVKSGTEKNRVISVHDPEMRHGRKSASKRFNGHKAAVAVEMESQLISAVEVLAGNAGDAEEERILTAKVPASHNGDCFPKSEFGIDLDQMEVRCPAGQSTRDYRSAGDGRGGQFLFAAATCQACPLRSQCVRGRGPRSISIPAEERLQQQARAHNQTEAGRQSLRERVVVEHRIARLVGLGIRKSRYFGRKKTRFQVVMAAVVANLSLVVGHCRRRAQNIEAAVPADTAVQLREGLLAAVSSFYSRFFGWERPALV